MTGNAAKPGRSVTSRAPGDAAHTVPLTGSTAGSTCLAEAHTGWPGGR
ncbi:hypothetical protein ACWDUB_10000 [Streptomyces fungicidicus]